MQLWRLKSPKICRLQAGPRKASGVIQSESEGLRTRGADDVNSSLRVGDSSSSNEAEKWDKFFFPSTFILFRSSTDWMGDAQPHRGGSST